MIIKIPFCFDASPESEGLGTRFSFGRAVGLGLGMALALFGVTAPASAVTQPADTIIVRDSDSNGGDYFSVDFEDNYLPNVVLRENGAASYEALKAQAVAARSFAYYKIQTQGFIRNGTSDQVYSYDGPRSNPGGEWARAVRETEGEILSFNNIPTVAFFVAGAIPTSSARATFLDPDPTNTERFVTYPFDDSELGPANTGTSLGFQGTASNPFYKNRGASSQNGADYQSDRGVQYYDILKYYYGGDIQLETVAPAPDYHTKTLAGFERNNDSFVRSLRFSGQTRNLGESTEATRTSAFAHSENGSQQLTFDYDDSADDSDGIRDGFFARHVSGVSRAQRLTNLTSGTAIAPAADPVGNIILSNQGSIGFWLKANPAASDAELSVSLALDNFDEEDYLDGDTDQGVFKNVNFDGDWRKYEWFLGDDTQWSSAFAPGIGDGQIASRLTLDSILFQGIGDSTVYLDDVFWDPNATLPVPEPSTLVAFAGFAIILGRRRRRA